MPPEKRKRLDQLLFDKKLVPSRQRGKSLIMAGKVRVNDQMVDKPGALTSTDAQITVKEDLPFVSRGGLKLQKALETFPIDPAGMTCMDVGASTGGFTDCLLQHGAKQVFAVDVGYGQLDWKLRNDKRVVVIERTNIRKMPMDAVHTPVDLVTIDVSFISLRIVIPVVFQFMKPAAAIIALIKPQFEIGKGKVGKGGVVRNPNDHRFVIDELMKFFQETGLQTKPVIPSPILGPKGNKEFLVLLTR